MGCSKNTVWDFHRCSHMSEDCLKCSFYLLQDDSTYHVHIYIYVLYTIYTLYTYALVCGSLALKNGS